MRIQPTDEMKKLENMIIPYINYDDPINNRFKDGTPQEIIEAQKKINGIIDSAELDRRK